MGRAGFARARRELCWRVWSFNSLFKHGAHDANHPPRPNRPDRLAHLPGLHDLRRAHARQPRLDLDEQASRPLIRQALELGINFFDTANAYSDGSSEEILGHSPHRDQPQAPRR